MIVTANFQEDLEQSHKAELLPFWEECYRAAFPNLIAIHTHRDNGWHQQHGIDRSIILANSKQILIDEKIRWRNRKTGKVYEDIALEHWSSFEQQTPGWVRKSLLADYIAYAIAPLGKCYLLPVPQLQGAWERNKEVWMRQYREIQSKNQGYTTISYGIPIAVLFPEIGKMLRPTFEPVDGAE